MVFPGVVNGQVAGTVRVPAGAMVDVAGIDAQNVAVAFDGGGQRVPIDATDLRQRAAGLMARAETEAASTPVPSTPVPTPAPTPMETPNVAQVQPPATPGNPLIQLSKHDLNAPVTLTNSSDAWTMGNGIVKVTILKHSGKVVSFMYEGRETLSPRESWEQLPSGTVTQSVTINPSGNDGERAEVSVKGVNGTMDIEARYAMQRGLSGHLRLRHLFSRGKLSPIGLWRKPLRQPGY